MSASNPPATPGLDKYSAPHWLGARANRRFHVMAKPAGSACNLECAYCFYLSKRVLPGGPVRVAIEAGVRMGWDRWLLGERGRDTKADFVGMSSFGASAPMERLYKEFGITAENTVAKAKALL